MGEAQSRVVISCNNAQLSVIEKLAASLHISFGVLGKVTDADVKVEGENWGSILDWKHKYDTAIESKMK